jgi:hypothetical protein
MDDSAQKARPFYTSKNFQLSVMLSGEAWSTWKVFTWVGSCLLPLLNLFECALNDKHSSLMWHIVIDSKKYCNIDAMDMYYLSTAVNNFE